MHTAFAAGKQAIDPKNSHLSPAAARTVGAALAALAVAAHGVALWLWAQGLQQAEQDDGARQALLAVGALLGTGQLAAFGVASALPVRSMRPQRVMLLGLGTLLVAAEIAAAALGHIGIVHAAHAAGSAGDARAEQLQRALDSRRASAESWRSLAARQAADGAITAASRSLARAAETDASADALAAELAQIQAGRRPQLTAPLGRQGEEVFAAVRSGLAPAMACVLASVAGALFRDARRPALQPAAVPRTVYRGVPAQAIGGRFMAVAAPLAVLAGAGVPVAPAAAQDTVPAEAAPRTGPVQQRGPVEAGVPDTVPAAEPAPAEVAPVTSPAQAQEAVPAGHAQDTEPVQQPAAVPAALAAPVQVQVQVQEAAPAGWTQATEPVQRPDTAPAAPVQDPRYSQIRAGVLAGTVTPSVRGLRAALGRGGTDTMRAYLAQLAGEGVIRRAGQAYEVVGRKA